MKRVIFTVLSFIALFSFLNGCENSKNNNSDESSLNGTSYTITFDANNGLFPDSTTEKTAQFTSNGMLFPDEPIQADYLFTGWNTASDGSGDMLTLDTPLTADITVYAQWIKRHIVTFSANDGIFPDSTTEKMVPILPEGIALPDEPTQDGYLFAGWNTSSDGSGDTFTSDTPLTADITVYAQWGKQYLITFHASGGTFPDSTTEKTLPFISGKVTLPDHPTQVDYVFTGWNTTADGSGKTFTPDTPLTGDITVYAQWKWRHTVTFHTNGGTFPDSTIQKILPLRSKGVVFPDEPTQSGYLFTGWNTASDGSGEALAQKVSAEADITVYAQWVKQYTVTFHTNGGLFPDNATEKTILLTPGGITFPDVPAQNGYLFAGWNTAADGSGSALTQGTQVSADITAYAQWKQQYTVTFYDTAGALMDHLTVVAVQEEEIALPALANGSLVTEWALDRGPVPKTYTGQYRVGKDTAFYAVTYTLIKTPKDLDGIRNHLKDSTVKYKLANDIDLSGYDNWIPIGSVSEYFTGLFDGGGHKITGLTIGPGRSSVGLFSVVGAISDPNGDKGHIRNLGVETSATGIMGGQYIGVIAGQLSGTVTNSYATGKLTGHDVIGGIIGIGIYADISSCFSSVYIDGTAYLGGIAGGVISSSIKDCFAVGNIVSTAGNDYAGGIAGMIMNQSSVSHCYYAGDIVFGTHAGGIVGAANASSSVTNNFVMSSVIKGNGDMGRVVSAIDTASTSTNNFVYSGISTGGGVDFTEGPAYMGTDIAQKELTTQAAYTEAKNGGGWSFPPWAMDESVSYPFNTDILNQVYITVVDNVTTIYPITGGRFTVPPYPSGKTSWNTRQDGAGTAYRPGDALPVKAGIILYAR